MLSSPTVPRNEMFAIAVPKSTDYEQEDHSDSGRIALITCIAFSPKV